MLIQMITVHPTLLEELKPLRVLHSLSPMLHSFFVNHVISLLFIAYCYLYTINLLVAKIPWITPSLSIDYMVEKKTFAKITWLVLCKYVQKLTLIQPTSLLELL